MCGIVGLISKDGTGDLVKRMAGALTHRGPDDAGIWADETSGVVLGHRRLAIIDLSSAGHQPMSSHCGRFILVFNGEIYNHLEMRRQLQADSRQLITWRGHSDTETLLMSFAVSGIEKTLQATVGMFALALWDRKEKELTLARDRMGEKPLYYGLQGNTFMFGSELKALKVHSSFQGKIDRQALTLFLRYNYVPAPHSIYQGIHKLPAGTLLKLPVGSQLRETIELGAPKAYWSLASVAARGQRVPFRGSESEAIDALESVLGNAVEGQQLSDVPLGAFLSGGIDSTLVASLMRSRSSSPVNTFTIGFDVSGYNEAENAKAVAKYLGTQHTELYLSPQDAMAVIPKLPHIYDEPFADSSQIPTFLVAQMAKQHVTVALSGDGGDELFGGYNRHVWGRSIQIKSQNLPGIVRRTICQALTSISPANWDRLNEGVERFLPLRYRVVHVGEKLHKLSRMLGSENDAELYRAMVSQWLNPVDVVLEASEPSGLKVPGIFNEIEHRMMYLDAMTYLPDDILCKVDRAAMGVSLETRAPFLDHRVAEFAWQLPLSMKIRNGQGKWLLRQLLYKHVPKHLIERPKQGFAIPIEQWLREPLREWAEELLSEERLRREGFFRPEPIRAAWKAHLTGKASYGYRLWSVLMFQSWYEMQACSLTG